MLRPTLALSLLFVLLLLSTMLFVVPKRPIKSRDDDIASVFALVLSIACSPLPLLLTSSSIIWFVFVGCCWCCSDARRLTSFNSICCERNITKIHASYIKVKIIMKCGGNKKKERKNGSDGESALGQGRETNRSEPFSSIDQTNRWNLFRRNQYDAQVRDMLRTHIRVCTDIRWLESPF